MKNEQTIRGVMTRNPDVVPEETTIADAARLMSELGYGSLIVSGPNSSLWGIVTDRDIVVRAIAYGKDPKTTQVGSICSRDPVCLSPSNTIDQAVGLMRDRAVRRIPVVEDGVPVGILSIGDLAMARQPDSALGDISAAPAQS